MAVDKTQTHKVQPDVSRHEADHPSSAVAHFAAHEPLELDCGIALAPWQIAYQTYGQLNEARTNAVLICHALTGDQYVTLKVVLPDPPDADLAQFLERWSQTHTYDVRKKAGLTA